MAVDGVRATVERRTVYGMSYRPGPLPAPRVPPVPEPVARSRAACESVTVHRYSYRRPGDRERRAHNISKPPRDHQFLAGDGIGRFGCTRYDTDYPAKTGPVSRPDRWKEPEIVRPVHVPVQSETTTGTAYGPPPAATTRPWRYRATVHKASTGAVETQTVQRMSYKPPPPPRKRDSVDGGKTKSAPDNCMGRDTAAAAADDWRRSASVPVENQTTYAKSYGGAAAEDGARLLQRGTAWDRLRMGTAADARCTRAHDYDSTICA